MAVPLIRTSIRLRVSNDVDVAAAMAGCIPVDDHIHSIIVKGSGHDHVAGTVCIS